MAQRFYNGQLVMRGETLCEVLSFDLEEKKYEVIKVKGPYAWTLGHFESYQLKPLMFTIITQPK